MHACTLRLTTHVCDIEKSINIRSQEPCKH